MRQQLFSKERMIYWPDEFVDVVDFLNGRNQSGQVISNPLFRFNTGPIILAACIGAKEKRQRDFGGSGRKEISTSTFAGQRLEEYIFLVPLMANPALGVDFLRPENEETVVSEFQKYVAGGLEVLRGEIEESAGKSPDMIIQSLVYKHNLENIGEEEMPGLL